MTLYMLFTSIREHQSQWANYRRLGVDVVKWQRFATTVSQQLASLMPKIKAAFTDAEAETRAEVETAEDKVLEHIQYHWDSIGYLRENEQDEPAVGADGVCRDVEVIEYGHRQYLAADQRLEFKTLCAESKKQRIAARNSKLISTNRNGKVGVARQPQPTRGHGNQADARRLQKVVSKFRSTDF